MGPSLPNKPDLGGRRKSHDRYDVNQPARFSKERAYTGPWSNMGPRKNSPPKGPARDQRPPQNTLTATATSCQTDAMAASTSTNASSGLPQDLSEEIRSSLGQLRRYMYFHGQLPKYKKNLENAEAEMKHDVNQAYPEIGENAKARFQVAEKQIEELQSQISETETGLISGFHHLVIDAARQTPSADGTSAEVDKRVQAMSQNLKSTLHKQMKDEFKILKSELHAHYEIKIISLEKRLVESESKNARLEKDMQTQRHAREKQDNVEKTDAVPQLATRLANLQASIDDQFKRTVVRLDELDETRKASAKQISGLETFFQGANNSTRIATLDDKLAELSKQLSELSGNFTAKLPEVTEKLDQLEEAHHLHESRTLKSVEGTSALSERVRQLDSASQHLTKNLSEVSESLKQLKNLNQSHEARKAKDHKAVLERVGELETASKDLNTNISELANRLKQAEEAGQRHEADLIAAKAVLSESAQMLQDASQHTPTNLSDVSERVERLVRANKRHEESINRLCEADGRHETRLVDLEKDNTASPTRVQSVGTASHANPAMPAPVSCGSQPLSEADLSSIRVHIAELEEKTQLIATATVQERLSLVTQNFGDFLEKERKARIQAEERLEHSLRSHQLLETRVQGHGDVMSAFNNNVRACLDGQNVLKEKTLKDFEDLKLQMDSLAQFQNNFSSRSWFDGIYAQLVQTVPQGFAHHLVNLENQVRSLHGRLSNIEQELGGAKRRKTSHDPTHGSGPGFQGGQEE